MLRAPLSRGMASAAGKVVVAPRRRSRLALRAPSQLTATAAERIKELLDRRRESGGGDDGPAALRVGVKTRGCSGMSYTMNYATEKKKLDEEVVEHGVTVWIDSAALMHIVGTTMDYVEDDLSAEFIFHNPNAEGSCGCGESFTTKPLDIGRADG